MKESNFSNTIDTFNNSTLYNTNNKLKKLNNYSVETSNLIDETRTIGFHPFNKTTNLLSNSEPRSYAENKKIIQNIMHKHKGISNVLFNLVYKGQLSILQNRYDKSLSKAKENWEKSSKLDEL